MFMADGFSIIAFLGGIKTAKETLTLMLDASNTLEKAELEYKIASLTKTLIELENQARDFEKVIQVKDAEIERLRTLLNTKASTQTDDLPDECILILEILSKELDPPTAQQIASKLEESIPKVEYFLDILKNNKLLTSSFNYRTGRFYRLNESGRKVLVEKKLL
jgi:DNA-binding MarR family transcriptional regulator